MPPSRQPTSPRRSDFTQTRVLAAAGLAALLGGFLVIALASTGGDGGTTKAAPPTSTEPSPSTTPKPTPKPALGTPIPVRGIGAYDPEGDRSENGGEAPLATDGNPTTAWKSEHYRTTFSKSGVGLVVDAGAPVLASRIVVVTETPGYTAQVQVGDSPEGPFAPVSGSQALKARTTFTLRPRSGRYLMLWITSMPTDGVAAVNELRATAAAAA